MGRSNSYPGLNVYYYFNTGWVSKITPPTSHLAGNQLCPDRRLGGEGGTGFVQYGIADRSANMTLLINKIFCFSNIFFVVLHMA